MLFRRSGGKSQRGSERLACLHTVTMSAAKKDAVQSGVFPVLFMSVEGEPMTFYLRPGPLKRQLKHLILTGGGKVSNVQQSGSILLIHPDERGSIPPSATDRYVSTKYIHDCVEKNEQLNLEDYRLNSKTLPRQSARLSSRDGSHSFCEGRIPYTPQEDAAILEYVNKHKAVVGGNLLWKEMEQQRLTAHSWQSMKKRYQVRLSKNQMGDEAQTTQNKEEEAEEKAQEDPDVEKAEEETASLQKHPAETDPTQVEEQPGPAGSKSQDKGDEEDGLQADEPAAETSDTHQAEEPRVDTQTEDEVGAAQPEDEPQSQPAAPPETPPGSSNRKLTEKHKASPGPESSPRRMTRRQLKLQAAASPRALGEKPRSPPPASSPQISERVESAAMSSQPEDGRSDEPPPKRSRRKTAKPLVESESEEMESDEMESDEMESDEMESEESGEAHLPETQQSGESDPEPQAATAQQETRPLGILELAAKEFDTDLSDEEAAAIELLPPPSDGDRGSGPSGVSPAAAEPPLPLPLVPESAASAAHLFIFDSESQELEVPSVSAAPSRLPPAGGAAALSLTQAQLEEDMQLIRELMTQSQQDLATVTKALLKTSGDPTAALELLLNPSSASGPFWSSADDGGLLSCDPGVLRQLQDKYGEEEVAKRIAFLEVER